MWPLCLHFVTINLVRSSTEAQRKRSGCLGRSKMAHVVFRHRHGRHDRREVLGVFKRVAQRSSKVAEDVVKVYSNEGRHTHRRGCRMDAQWSPRINEFYCKHYLLFRTMLLPPLYYPIASFGRPIASIEQSLWRALCLDSAKWICTPLSTMMFHGNVYHTLCLYTGRDFVLRVCHCRTDRE